MAVLKIFPIQDNFIDNLNPDSNYGLDEILELNNISGDCSRILVKFSNDDIQKLLANNSSSYEVSLKLYEAESYGLESNVQVDIYSIGSDWDMGSGRRNISPQITDYSNWYNAKTLVSWNPTGSGLTGSISGGGDWKSDVSLYTSQSFTYYSTTRDINVDITTIFQNWVATGSGNNGVILKYNNESDLGHDVSIKYYSRDTHTIYPPEISFKYDDQILAPFSCSGEQPLQLDDSDFMISSPNNGATYYNDSVKKFRIFSVPRYPRRTYSTVFRYNKNYYFPLTSSYWSIKDLDTNETVIDFDTNYTKLSADSESSYFNISMDFLEPERYYKILVKTEVAGEEIVFDGNIIFKVINR